MGSGLSFIRQCTTCSGAELLEAQRPPLGELTMGMSHEISQPLQAMTLTIANLK